MSKETPQGLNVEAPAVIIINGGQGEGKSSLIRYLIGINRNKLSYGIIFSNTAFSDDSNYDYISDMYVHPHYNEEKLSNLMTIQEGIDKDRRPNCFVVFDDCLFEPKQWASTALKKLVSQVRHYKCLVIISTQYPQAVPSYFRSVSFHSFIFAGLNTENAVKSLYGSYGMAECENWKEFQKFIQGNTGNFQFIYVNLKSKDERFKVMRCPKDISKFRLEF